MSAKTTTRTALDRLRLEQCAAATGLTAKELRALALRRMLDKFDADGKLVVKATPAAPPAAESAAA